MFLENTSNIIKEESNEFIVEDFFSYILDESMYLMQINEEFHKFERSIIHEQHEYIINEQTGSDKPIIDWVKVRQMLGKAIAAVKEYLKKLAKQIIEYIRKYKVKILLDLMDDKNFEALKMELNDSVKKMFIFFSKKPAEVIHLFEKQAGAIDELIVDPDKATEKLSYKQLEDLAKNYDRVSTAFKASIKLVTSTGSLDAYRVDFYNIIDAIKKQRDEFHEKIAIMEEQVVNDKREIERLEKELSNANENDKNRIQDKLNEAIENKNISTLKVTYFIKHSSNLISLFNSTKYIIKRSKK